jgi:adenosine deaminase
MYYILHQHYESVLRLTKLINPKKLDNFYSIFNDVKFLKLKPQERLKFLQKSMPIPDEKYFILKNFNRIAQQTAEEMIQYNIDHIDLRISLNFERWKEVENISQAKQIYNKALNNCNNKTISFIAAIDLTKSEIEIEKNIRVLFNKETHDSIVGIDITMHEEGICKFNKYYNTFIKLRENHNKKINMHLGEFTSDEVNCEILEKIKPDRIGHGITLLKSSILCKIIKDNGICLDMCPISNKILGVVDWSKYNPIQEAIALGIPVTINTDDPVMFNTNINKELKIANLNHHQLKLVVENSKRYCGKSD